MECRRGLAMGILSVRLSVRMSVKCVHCDKTEEKAVQIFILYERPKSSINTNRKSTTRFPMSLRWSSYVAPKPPKTQSGRFPSKIALRLKKVCYKVSLCENCQRQSCKAFIGLTIRAKNDWWGRPLLPEILDQTDRVGAIRRFSISFRS